MFNEPQGGSGGLGIVLLVEDEALVSAMIEDYLLELGASRVIVAASAEQALEALIHERPSCAILDVLVGARDSFPVADALVKRGIPFAFVSGFGREDVVARHRDRPFLGKPFHIEHLTQCVAGLVPGTRMSPEALDGAPPGP